MKMSRIVTLAVLAGILFSGCTKKNGDGDLAIYHVAYPYQDAIKTWDPADAYDQISNEAGYNVFETLYQYAFLSKKYKLEPLLAADMPKFSTDKLTLTIPIKHGVLFQDDPCFKATNGKGRELKAQDFVFEFKRLALPSIQSQLWWLIDGKLKGVNDYHDKLVKAANKDELAKIFDQEVEGIKALDDYTLQIKLIKPYPQLLNALAMTATSPVPKEAIDAYADPQGKWNDHPVATGPFVLKEWERNSRVILARNPTHHPDFYPTEADPEYKEKGMLADAGKQLPLVDEVHIEVIKEKQPAWLKFLNADLDMAEIDKDNMPKMVVNRVNLNPEYGKKGMRLDIEKGVTFFYISFNMKDKLIGENKYLRQALSTAIDREKWIEVITSGSSDKMVNALPIGVPGRPDNKAFKLDYNLEMAKELLKKAGYPNGEGLPVIKFDLRRSDSEDRQQGEYMQRAFAEIGVKIDVIPNTFPAYLEKMKQGNLQVSIGGWGMDYPDAENVYQLLYGPNKAPGPGEANFDYPPMNKLYEEMAIMENGPKRAALIQQMEDIIQDQAPWAYGYYKNYYFVTQPWLQNFRGNEIIMNKYKYFRIDKDVKKRYQSSN